MKLSFRRAQKIGALATALTLASLLTAGPAQAHDALSSSSPSNGDTVTTNPGKVSITLTKAPSTDLPGSNIIKVTAPDGHVISSGEVTLEDATLSTTAEIDHPGEHKVEWRTVSADGHPIDGTFTFTYAEPGAAGTSTTPAADATEQATVAVAQEGNDISILWLFAGGVLILAIVILGAFALGQRKKKETSRDE